MPTKDGGVASDAPNGRPRKVDERAARLIVRKVVKTRMTAHQLRNLYAKCQHSYCETRASECRAFRKEQAQGGSKIKRGTLLDSTSLGAALL